MFWSVLIVSLSLLITSCGGGSQSQGQSQPDYKSVKSMVLDIMQTEEAKKTLSTMMKDEKFKQNVVMDESTVRTTLIKSIAQPNNPQIKEAFKDPKFTTVLAKSMKNENKQLLKDLMKDPEYQKLMIDIMKDPEYQKSLLDLMKSSAYRKQTMQVMKESLQSPLFQAQLLKLMESANESMMKPQQEKTSKKSGKGKGKGSQSSTGGNTSSSK